MSMGLDATSLTLSRAAAEPVAVDYRADIDGLRALCVAAVILFHAGVPGFTGGYIGVDVFFVISGYLITALLTKPSSQPVSRRLATFYARRARRILPALLLVLVVCTVLALLLLLPAHLIAFGRSLALSSALLANLGAWREGGYFGLDAVFTPLRHLWSIAVEEQFYLVYPLILLVLGRHLLRLRVTAIAVLAAASFLLCVVASYAFTRANYYSLPTRGWQLLLGALLALGAVRLPSSRRVNEWLAALALLVLGAVIHFYDSQTRYPGVLAVVPSVAAVVLIACMNGQATLVGRVLAWRPFVFTGLISYSLYLWHAPVLTFFRYFNIEKPSAIELVALIAAIYGLAAASWWAIEQPVRSRAWLRSTPRFVLVALLISIALITTGLVLRQSDGLPQRFSRDVLTLTSDREMFGKVSPDCISMPLERIAAGQLCRYVPGGKPRARALVWGDSHALVLLPVYEEIARVRDIEIYFGIGGACRPLLGIEDGVHNDFCGEFNAAMLQAISALRPDVVILNAYWIYPNVDPVANDALHLVPGDSTFRRALEETLHRIQAPERATCTVLDVPGYAYQIPYALAIAHRRGIGTEFMTLSRAQAREQQRPVEREIHALAQRGLTRIADPKEALCRDTACLLVRHDGVPLYRDDHHLSAAGAGVVAATLNACFE